MIDSGTGSVLKTLPRARRIFASRFSAYVFVQEQEKYQIVGERTSEIPSLSFALHDAALSPEEHAVSNSHQGGNYGIIRVYARIICGIHLIVSDSGVGFDVEAVKQGKGLGLTSMRERVRLVNGTIDIKSKPLSGTTLHIRVPLGSVELSQRAAR